MIDPGLFHESSLREKMLEHLLVADLMRSLWRRGRRDIEVLRPEVDRGGYDLVLASNGVTRHVQLKSSYTGAKTAHVTVNTGLAEKPNGCVVWVRFDPETLALGPFYWFGGAPGEGVPCLGTKVARHAKGDKDGVKAKRPSHRVVAKAQFEKLGSMDDLLARLFGEEVVRVASGATPESGALPAAAEPPRAAGLPVTSAGTGRGEPPLP